MKISALPPTNKTEGLNPVREGSEKIKDPKLEQSAKELEGLFIGIMIKAMEKTIPDASLTGSKNNLSKMMFSSVMGKELAEQGGFGMSDFLYRALAENGSTAINKLKNKQMDLPLVNLNSVRSTDE